MPRRRAGGVDRSDVKLLAIIIHRCGSCLCARHRVAFSNRESERKKEREEKKRLENNATDALFAYVNT